MLMDPSESWLSRILRWTLWAVILIGIAIYQGNGDAFWGFFSYLIIIVGIYFAIQAFIVEPLQNHIRVLERKIDRLSRKMGISQE